MIRVLVAEDSDTVRRLLVEILEADPEILVVGEARNGEEAVRLTKRLRPDVVSMDIFMPGMDGFDATRQIMSEVPTPIVLVTANLDIDEAVRSMNAMQLGALHVMMKPTGPGTSSFARDSQEFRQMLKTLSQIRVLRHPRTMRRPDAVASPPPLRKSTWRLRGDRHGIRVVAIATSTGGPAALRQVLGGLPARYPHPILVVQHISPGFIGSLATSLRQVTRLDVKVAEDRELLRGGTVYLAPDGVQMGVKGGRVALSSAPEIRGFRPSATFLFESVADCFGRATLAVVLTGMGEDGVTGLYRIRERGGYVLAQDEDSSVVFGMPGAAVASGLVDEDVTLARIADRLMEVIGDV
ncbi:MAG: chemotaxis-specific protein-glutamate methyltransferase CheB [Pseudomonadota bacterium]